MDFPKLVLSLAFLSIVQTASAQGDLRTAPLTAPRIRHHNDNNYNNNRTGVFSKWPTIENGHRRRGKMESELAAIFRGVAYGVSTLPTTTTIPTTTTTTTTYKPVVKMNKVEEQKLDRNDNHKIIQKDNQSGIRHKSINPTNFPNWREAEFSPAETYPLSTQIPPIQYPYAEAPDVAFRPTPSQDLEPTIGITDVQVVRADNTEIEWIRNLGITWYIHVYTAAGLYCIISFLALLWIIRVSTYVYLIPSGYYITINVLMFVASILRCVHLFHDPYGAKQKLPEPLSQAVEEATWPCLTAAVAVVVMAIVRAWQCPRLIPQHNYVPLGLALLTMVHFLMTLTSLLTAYLVPDKASAISAASRAVTLAWGSTVGICGLFATWKVGRDSQRHSGQLSSRIGVNHLQTITPHRNPRKVLLHGTNLALVSCLAQICLAGLHFYALVGPHYILEIPPAYPWYWMTYQSTSRILEIVTWILLCATTALNLGISPNKRSDSSGETKLLSVLGCQCCGSSTSIATHENVDDMYTGACQTNRSVRNFTLLNCGKGGFQETLADPLMGSGNSEIRIKQNMPLNKSPYPDNNADVHMLWNKTNNFPNTTPTPSSMICNESGFVRFNMNAHPSQVNDEFQRKSLQNLDLVSQIHDSRYQNKKLSQNQLNVSEYCDDPPPYEKVPASPLLSNKPSIDSLHHQSGGNLEQLLQNQINTKLYTSQGKTRDNHSEVASITDVSSTEATSPPPTGEASFSKYASTCSSISAANSFDVRMFNDIEVAQYYQNPSSASYHTYASLHRPSSQGHQSQQNIQYRLPNDVAFNFSEPNQSTSQLKALLSPKNTVKNKLNLISLSPTDTSQDIDVRLNNARYNPQFKKSVSVSPSPKRSPHLNLRYDTPDSGLAMDYYGYTDKATGLDFHFDSHNEKVRSRLCSPNQDLLQQQQNFPQNYRGGSPHQELQQHQQNFPQNYRGGVNYRQQQSPILSDSRPPLHPGSPILQEKHRLQLQYQLQMRIQNEQLKQQSQQRQKELLVNQRKLENNELSRTHNRSPSLKSVSSSYENVNMLGSVHQQEIQPHASPLLSRSASFNASNSDLHSDCLDSEEGVKPDQSRSKERQYENVFDPENVEAWPPPNRLFKQAAV